MELHRQCEQPHFADHNHSRAPIPKNQLWREASNKAPEALLVGAGDDGERIGAAVQVGADQVLGREQLQLEAPQITHTYEEGSRRKKQKRDMQVQSIRVASHMGMGKHACMWQWLP